MKSKETEFKFVEWLSADAMHNSSKNWISELNFIKDEQVFLGDLIKSNTLHLIETTHFEESKEVVSELSELKKKTKNLLKAVKTHEQGLGIMVDGINQPIEEENYKKEHRNLIIEVSEFFGSYRALKRKLFDLISTIMKEGKQKRILKNK